MLNNIFLSKQHLEIRRAIRELEEDIQVEQEVIKNALWIALKIGTLSGILLVHLKYEDEFLYPELINSVDPEIKKVSSWFNDDMGTLAQEFQAYQKKFLQDPGAIRSNATEFIKETGVILGAINKRVEAEENLLYPLLAK